MFLANNKSSKNLANNTMKASQSNGRLKIMKSKINASQARSGLKTAKNVSVKTRNLYYELKNAMTEKLNEKGIECASKRNSLQNLHSESSRGTKFNYTTLNGGCNKLNTAPFKNISHPKKFNDSEGSY